MPKYERKTIDLLISDDLRTVLEEIESDSVVAKLLLKKRHNTDNLATDYVNYISVSHDDRGKISYLSPDRMKSLDVDDYWTSKSRYKGKPGSFVSKVFKDISPKEVEKFSSLFKSQSLMSNFTFKIVEDVEIKKYYHYSSYFLDEDGSTRGSLGASCMKHDHCQNVLKLYTKNTDQVKLLIMLDANEKLIGRALLWNLENNKIMDRIYTKQDEDLQFHFKKWATRHGYLYKSEQNWNNTLFFENLNIKRKELYLEFNLGKNPTKYPYMDTFKFININSGRLFNYIPDNIPVVTLTASNGNYNDSDQLRLDGIDKVFRYSGEVRWLPYLNLHTYNNSCSYSEINETYIYNRDCEYDRDLNDYLFTGEYTHLNNNELIEQKREYLKQRLQTLKEHPTAKVSLSNVITELSNNIGDLTDLTNLGSSIYGQWTRLSRSANQLTEVVDTDDTEVPNDLLEEVQTPF